MLVRSSDESFHRAGSIAIDPRQVTITRTIAGLGKGPGHSLIVLPDKKKAAVNVAGDNLIAFLDLEHGILDATLQRMEPGSALFPRDERPRHIRRDLRRADL